MEGRAKRRQSWKSDLIYAPTLFLYNKQKVCDRFINVIKRSLNIHFELALGRKRENEKEPESAELFILYLKTKGRKKHTSENGIIS